MITAMGAKRGRGIDDVLKSLQPQAVEELRLLETPAPSSIEKALHDYQRYLQEAQLDGVHYNYQKGIFIHSSCEELELGKFPHLLRPAEINAFLACTIPWERHQNYKTVTGVFLTRLIERSYHQGFNHFELALNGASPLNYVGLRLQGTKANPVAVTLTGNLGHWFAREAAHGDFQVYGTVEMYSTDQATNSSFYFDGKVGKYCGGGMITGFRTVLNCQYEFKDTVESFSTGTIGCTFTVHQHRTLKMLQRTIGKSNTIISVRKGVRRLVRDYKRANEKP